MKCFVLTLVFIVIFNQLQAQGEQKEFKKVFDKELEEQHSKYSHRENHSGAYQYTKPQQVPSWICNPPVIQGDEVYAIGISDPGLDSVHGMEQALFRAKIMANLFYTSTTQLLCDFFMNELDHSTSIAYEHFTRISAKIPKNGGTYSLIEYFLNGFDETMVLIKYSPVKKIKKNQADNIRLELYKNETESETHGEYESIYELQVAPPNFNDSVKDFYQLTEFGSRYDVVSKVNGDNVQVPIYSLKYVGIPTTDSVHTAYVSHGLWKEYFKSVMLQIVGKAREKPENISVLSDDYQKDSYQKLTRGISVNRQRFVYSRLSKKDEKLVVEMQELDVP